MQKLHFCRECGQMMRFNPGEQDCENCGANTDNPIVGEFTAESAEALAEVA